MNITTATTVPAFSTNQIVRGARAGTFVILGFRLIDGEDHAQVKPVHPTTHAPGRGEFSLPVSALRPLAA